MVSLMHLLHHVPLNLGRSLACEPNALAVSLDTMTLMHDSWFMHHGVIATLDSTPTVHSAGMYHNSSSVPRWGDKGGGTPVLPDKFVKRTLRQA
jgi:hypothetical protein